MRTADGIDHKIHIPYGRLNMVAAVGDNVSQFALGDEVYAMVRFPEDLMTGSGAYAEYVCVPASELAMKPAGIDHVQAQSSL